VSSARLGYSDEELHGVPEGSDLGLGCGNPQALAELRPGEIVLDLGAGGGIDCFMAARRVGEAGRVIGVDMTPEMVAKARANAEKGGYANVEFRLGEIERLPVADSTIDVVISNCVINLSPDKPSVYREAYRVLKPGGRIAISDVLATSELPDHVRNDLGLQTACVGGAVTIDDLTRLLTDVGFRKVAIRPKDESRQIVGAWAPGQGWEDHIFSASIQGEKPRG
jgi:ubiquinone/menaquinone biosynthesis C-methylase UbiE